MLNKDIVTAINQTQTTHLGRAEAPAALDGAVTSYPGMRPNYTESETL